jgi:16S rRNA (cytosine1402-N4)-methyltransferase
MSDESERPKRRQRYRGTHPRRFEEKYKELDPARDPETVAKVIASGKTPAGSHVPVMVEECLAALKLVPGQCGVDATLGHGGHAVRILERIGAEGFLVGLDVDPLERPKTEARLRGLGFDGSVFEGVKSNYAGISKVVGERFPEGVDFVFADLGCSSMQLDDPARGFSFKTAGPLDMRMNPGRGLSAAEWIERVGAEDFEKVLMEHADEPRAGALAGALAGRRFGDTLELVRAVREAMPRMDEEVVGLAVRRVFQAVRIAVNDEFSSLDAFLRVLPGCLKAGGRAVILTFHSGEDRRVKKAFQQGEREGIYQSVSDGVVVAGGEERRMNPRSVPAKLRWAVKG